MKYKILFISLITILSSCKNKEINKRIEQKDKFKIIEKYEISLLKNFQNELKEIAIKENFNSTEYDYQTGNWNETLRKNILESYYLKVDVNNEFLSDLLSERNDEVDSKYKQILLNNFMFIKGRANLSLTIDGEVYDQQKEIFIERKDSIDVLLVGPIPKKPNSIEIATQNHSEKIKIE